MSDLTRSDDIERDLFRKYAIALRLWARKFNTAEIATPSERAGAYRSTMDLALAGVEPV